MMQRRVGFGVLYVSNYDTFVLYCEQYSPKTMALSTEKFALRAPFLRVKPESRRSLTGEKFAVTTYADSQYDCIASWHYGNET